LVGTIYYPSALTSRALKLTTHRGEGGFRVYTLIFSKYIIFLFHVDIRAGGLNKWQRRYWVAKNNYLAYYKDENSKKVLATFDLRQVKRIDMITGSEFEIGTSSSI